MELLVELRCCLGICYKGCLAGLERKRNKKQFTQLILGPLSLDGCELESSSYRLATGALPHSLSFLSVALPCEYLAEWLAASTISCVTPHLPDASVRIDYFRLLNP